MNKKMTHEDCKGRGEVVTSDGKNNFYFNLHTHLDWNGNPVERTPDKCPYSYDAYVVTKKAEKYEHAVYSDRLLQQDWDKHNALCQKHFGNKGQYWNNREFSKIQDFLRDFYSKPDLKLVGIMKGCNVSNGYPYWIFMFNCKF